MTKEQIKAKLFELFEEWHRGETVGINPDGSYNYYSHDVSRFVHAIKTRVVEKVPTPDMDPM